MTVHHCREVEILVKTSEISQEGPLVTHTFLLNLLRFGLLLFCFIVMFYRYTVLLNVFSALSFFSFFLLCLDKGECSLWFCLSLPLE